MTYQYWTIRFVPNVARGEFTNIGIVCGRDGRDWAVRFDTRYIRNHGDWHNDVRELNPWISNFRRVVNQHRHEQLTKSGMSVAYVEHFRSRQVNAIQFSERQSVDASSAEDGVNILFPHLVTRTTKRRRVGLTRARIRNEIRDYLVETEDFKVGYDLFLNTKASIGKQRGGFDLLRAGDEGRVLTNAWAFNVMTLEVLEREIQSWNYLVTRLRDTGGALSCPDGRTLHLEPDVPIQVVFDEPISERQTEWRSDIFDAAREAWQLNGIEAINYQTMESVLSTQ